MQLIFSVIQVCRFKYSFSMRSASVCPNFINFFYIIYLDTSVKGAFLYCVFLMTTAAFLGFWVGGGCFVSFFFFFFLMAMFTRMVELGGFGASPNCIIRKPQDQCPRRL